MYVLTLHVSFRLGAHAFVSRGIARIRTIAEQLAKLALRESRSEDTIGIGS
jgi:hypothetical protein